MMPVRIAMLTILFCMGLSAEPNTLEEFKAVFIQELKERTKKYSTLLEDIHQNLQTELNNLEKKFQSKGDLDSVIYTRDLIKTYKEKPASLLLLKNIKYPALQKVIDEVATIKAKLDERLEVSITTLQRSYVSSLNNRVKALTKADLIGQALLFKNEMEAIKKMKLSEVISDHLDSDLIVDNTTSLERKGKDAERWREITIPANSDGVTIGSFMKGEFIEIQYVSGVWGSGGSMGRNTKNPDLAGSSGTTSACLIQGAEEIKGIPSKTVQKPSVFKIEQDGELKLRIADTMRSDNVGSVVYKVRRMQPIFHFKGFLDTSSYLTLSKDSLILHHFTKGKYPKNLEINGAAWMPNWKERQAIHEVSLDSLKNLEIVKVNGRGFVEVLNDHSSDIKLLKLELSDRGRGGDYLEFIMTSVLIPNNDISFAGSWEFNIRGKNYIWDATFDGKITIRGTKQSGVWSKTNNQVKVDWKGGVDIIQLKDDSSGHIISAAGKTVDCPIKKLQ